MISHTNTSRFILIVTALFTLVTGVWIFIHPAALFPDPGWGFQVMRGMRMGGGFNMLPTPDENDFAKNHPEFLSWWSPGQYLVPYFFISLFKLTIGQATAMVATICSLCGLAGLYMFFKKAGFSATISALSILFIACQQAYWTPFIFYNGGEVLIFAFTGWFLYGCISINNTGTREMLFLFLSGLIGFLCKSSFMWVYFAGALYLWLMLIDLKKITAQWIVNGLKIGVPVIASLVIIFLGYLSKGQNPASDTAGLKLTWQTFGFPAASPLLAGFSVDDMTKGLITNTASPVFSPAGTILVLMALALISLLIIILILRIVPYRNYKLLLLIIYGASILFFGVAFLRQANISYESRHMRIIGLLITPGVIYVFSRYKLPFRMLFGMIWIFIAFITFNFLIGGMRVNNRRPHGQAGLAQQFIDKQTLDEVLLLDKQQQNATFVFISPDLGLDIARNRIITFDPLNDNLNSEIDNTIFQGHAGPVYMVLPLSYQGAKAAVYMKSFPAYAGFKVIASDKKYLIYMAQ